MEMCKCTPAISNQYCGRIGCNPPKESAGFFKRPALPHQQDLSLMLKEAMAEQPDGIRYFLTARVRKVSKAIVIDGLSLTKTP